MAQKSEVDLQSPRGCGLLVLCQIVNIVGSTENGIFSRSGTLSTCTSKEHLAPWAKDSLCTGSNANNEGK